MKCKDCGMEDVQEGEMICEWCRPSPEKVAQIVAERPEQTSGFLITLERSLPDDVTEAVINAIKLIKFVAVVEPIIYDQDLQIAYTKACYDIEQVIFSAPQNAKTLPIRPRP